MQSARPSTSKLTPTAFSLAVSAVDIHLEGIMDWQGGKAIAGWYRLRSRETGELSNYKHYLEVHELEVAGSAHARCGMLSGTIERGFFKNLFKRRCQKCMRSEMADLKRQWALMKRLYGNS